MCLVASFTCSYVAALSITYHHGFCSAPKVYQQKEWVLRSWRDVFVDLVQGQLQHLFLSLLSGLAL